MKIYIMPCLFYLFFVYIFTETNRNEGGSDLNSLHNFRVLLNCYGVQLNTLTVVFRRVRNFAKSDYYLRHFCPSIRPSVRPHRATLFPVDEVL
jgi:hypothetical protein